tara:strand:+ start:3117 stop:4748 length:1632 start_codon:yes stop_codon:yes gene_type:complete
MAIKIYNDITLDSNQIKDVSLERLAANPAGFEGQIYYNTIENTIRYYNGATGAGVWIELDGAGDVTTVTAGDGLKDTGTATDPIIEIDYTSGTNIIVSAGTGTTLLSTNTFLANVSGTVQEFPISDIISLATSDVTSLTVDIGAVSGGAPLTQDSTTAAVTISSRAYGGGANIGYVPDSGDSLTFLNGGGNWTTPPNTQASWTAIGDSGTQTISSGNTLVFTGSTGIDTSLSSNVLTFTLDLTELTANGTAAAGTDRVAGVWSGVQGTKQLQGIPLNLFGTPTGAIAMGSQKITGLADPSNDQDAATKAYVDSVITGGLIFQGAYDASAAPSAAMDSALEGWTYSVSVAGDGAGYWATTLEVGDLIIANNNDPASESEWTEIQNNIDLATNSVAGIAKFPTANGFATITDGVVKLSAGSENSTTLGSTSESLQITTDAFGKILTSSAAAISITSADITNFDAAVEVLIDGYSVSITFGDGALSSFVLTHSLGTLDVMVQVYEVSSKDTVECSVSRTDVDNITVNTGSYVPVSSGMFALITKIL